MYLTSVRAHVTDTKGRLNVDIGVPSVSRIPDIFPVH